MTLRIGHLSTFYHTSALLLADPDFPARLGTDVVWHLHGTGPAIVEDFRHHLLDIAYVGLPPAIIGMAAGVPIRCVAGGHMEGTVIAGASSLRAYPEVRHLDELFAQMKGLRIGVPGKGSIHDVILSDCVQRFGLEDNVEVVNYRWSDALTEAFVRGEVSVAVGTPALAVSIHRFGGGKVLWPPRLLWPDNPSYGILAHQMLIDSDPETISRFLRCHEEASELLRKRPDEAARRISSFVGVVDEDFVLETIALSPRYCAQISEPFARSTLEFAATLVDLGYASRELSEADIFDTRFIRAVHPAGDHYHLPPAS